jgi:transcriptional regulator with XRE-family HTH domain
MSFGKRLRKTIKAHGLQIGEVAELVNTDSPHICHMCADKKAPSLDTLSRLLKALPDADARWLVCGGKRA